MELSEAIRRRRMVRNYDPDRPVPPEIVERILGQAIRAPSAGFSQGWAFLVLDDPLDRADFWAATTPRAPAGAPGSPADAVTESRWLRGMRNAPLIIVPLSHRSAYLERYAEPDKGWTDRDEARWSVPYWHLDTGMAALLMLLTVVDEGLGGCFFGIPPDRTGAFLSTFGVPPAYTPIGAITVGYRAPDHRPASLRRGRRPLDEVVHRGRWQPAKTPQQGT